MFSFIKYLTLFSIAFNQCINCADNSEPHFVGDRKVIVQLFEWKYEDIARECETFLALNGFAGVQISPAHENAVFDTPPRPWFERYQPVSYKLVSRSGNEYELRNMIYRCNSVGVRVYVDIVLNHMTAPLSGKGTDGTPFNGTSESYPGVPYNATHFHGHESCPTPDLQIQNFSDPIQTRNCFLVGLRDLNQTNEYVRQKQIQFLNHLIDMGVSGFRSDLSYLQWPADLKAIISRLHNLNPIYFGFNRKPFFYHEVAVGAAKVEEYTDIGRVIDFNYVFNLTKVVRKVEEQKLKYLRQLGENTGLKDKDSFVTVDSHDLQRGNTGDLKTNIAFFDPKLLKISTAFMLSWPYGVPRIMSSYYWTRNLTDNEDANDWMGPPHDPHYNTNGVKINANHTCANGWVCEHRWRAIYRMVEFRNVAGNEKVTNWWDNGNNSIAFSRGNKAFIAINNDNQAINQTLQTGLPAGRYCDIISGDVHGLFLFHECTGKEITVERDGSARIEIDNKADNPIIAIHMNSKF